MLCFTAKLNESTTNHLLFKSSSLEQELKVSLEADAGWQSHLCSPWLSAERAVMCCQASEVSSASSKCGADPGQCCHLLKQWL